MRLITISNAMSKIYLGKQGENNAAQIRFPIVKEWKELYGIGVFNLLNQRPSESDTYAVSILATACDIIWDVTNTDTAIPGIGRCELNYIVGDTVAKSITYLTTIEDAIAAEGDIPPEPWESWVDDVLQASSRAEQSAENASQSAENAEMSERHAETSAQSAQAAADSMSYVSFTMSPNGSLLVENSERLGTTSFALTHEGKLEVNI